MSDCEDATPAPCDGHDSPRDHRGEAPETGAGTTAEAPAGGREWSLDELADAYAYPEGDRVWLRANMVSSLDGAGQHDGRSQPLSSETDMRIFGTLRGLADVIVVGAETVRLEGYRPARAREAFAARRAAAGQGPAPVIAVVTASLDLDFSLPLFTEPLVRTLILTGAAAPAERVQAARKAGAEVLVAGDGAACGPGPRGRGPRGARAAAPADRGRAPAAGSVRGGGGPRRAVSDALADDDRGWRPADRRGPSVAVPTRFSVASVLEQDGFLFTRYRRI